MAYTSDHIKPCNIGQSEAHNRRSAEYLAHINKEKIYVRTDLAADNESWRSPQMGNDTLQQYYDNIARMVKQITGRAMQTKERQRIDKRTGRVIKISGSSPLRESVVVCKSDTTMEQLRDYCERCHQRFGIMAIQIHIHRDEGHYENPGDKNSWKPNCHAHIIWDWMNHETGKSFKLNSDDMSTMQDMVADSLQMERGKSKTETSKQHLERNDFILAKQKEQSTVLDHEIAEKRDRLDAENGNAIRSGVANLFGKGKYADIEKENKRLKEELPKQKAALQRQYQQVLDSERTQQERKLAEKDKLIDNLKSKYKSEAFRHQQDNQEKDRIIRQQERVINDYRERLGHYLSTLSELLREAVRAVIDFVQSGYRNFTYRQEGDIKRYMSGQSDKEEAADIVLNASLPFLKADDCKRVKSQLDDIAQDMKEEHKQNRSRGFRL